MYAKAQAKGTTLADANSMASEARAVQEARVSEVLLKRLRGHNDVAAMVDERLENALIRLRGAVPTDGKDPQQQPDPDGIVYALDRSVNRQDELLNSITRKLVELERIV